MSHYLDVAYPGEGANPGRKRLHIGLVVPGFSAAEDDWCIPALLNLVRRLAAQHEVTVYTLRYPHSKRQYQIFGARVRSFGGSTSAGWQRIPLLGRAIKTILADARRQSFSILHGLWADEAGFVAAMAARSCKKPVLVSLMGGELVGMPAIGYGVQLSRSGRVLTNLSLRLASGVSAGSPQLLEQAENRVSLARLHWMPLGVDLALFVPAPTHTPTPASRLVHAASLTAVKDQNTMLEAFALARTALAPLEISLHIAGDGPLRYALVTRARELGIDDHVQFYGAVPHEYLPDFYNKAQLFLLSSLHESQSLALLEAAACGLPAVGTRVGLLPQLLPEECLSPPGDAQALANAIVRMLSDDTARRREARRLTSLVRSKYGLDVTVDRLLDVYQELLTA